MVGVKRSKKIVEDDYVPSSDDDDEDYVVSGEEEEGEQEEDGEETQNFSTPPPTPTKTSKVKPPTRVATPARKRKVREEEEEDEEDVRVAAPRIITPARKKVAKVRDEDEEEVAEEDGKKNKPAVKKVDKLLIKRKPQNSDFEIQVDPTSKITDLSICGPKFPRNKLLLDERHWVQISSVSYKSKGVSFDQVFIGRNPHKGDKGKDGNPPKPFHMALPIRCLEPLWRACNVLTSRTPEEK